ncbi:MAG: hypothetical protein A3B25_01030 [Candidatus Ryanbacteria bacterium RIFCSPLOWO2_01_FULL_48_26]|uniref:Cell shape-determining protein MreC n=1 Tax=Candidatus Ryanbacteria bacterium RIFCSPLOWO2_01_FULL_48_26 TaxID=1802126 RepID=A0A1G2GRR4_9BACT|nr:MAG: hypothetical protein A3B25_01030 [Candidatus Ryanbacteria bacterium RIFCSPLOWO2_01_FULL_48_26]
MKKGFIFLSVLVLLTAFFLALKQGYGFRLREMLAPLPSMPTAESTLTAENERLKAELAELQNIKSQLPLKPEKGLEAIVYSRYPLNFKSELLVNAGAREKISKGRAVIFGGMLIGKVSEVFEETSLVQTVFDERFQLAVRIGKDGAQALLQGGSFPTLSLISPTETIQPGDIVYSTGVDFPYGLPVAEIKDVRVSDDKLFQISTLDIPYDIGRISAVFIAE